MKTRVWLVLSMWAAVVLSSCSGNTYSKLLSEEKDLIKDYIKREGINVVYEEPEEYGPKDYYLVAGYDNLYYHRIVMGDTTQAEIESGNAINMRYKKFQLTTHPDTISYWNTDDGGYPVEFRYGDNSNDAACKAWHIAIGLMKYPGTECQIICPSKLGFTVDNTSVTPYGYILKVDRRK